jgi:HlyD family secretion protein
MADKAKGMFRKAALDKLSSPERLDVLMQVTSPVGWLAATSLAVVIVLVILWAVFGTISTKVSGTGLLLRGSAVLAVTSDTMGRVDKLLVSSGEVVDAGQVIATLRQDDLETRIENQLALLADLERQNEALSTEMFEQALLEKARSQRELVAKGLITRSALLATESEIQSLRRQAAGRLTEIDQLRRTIAELENRLAQSTQVVSPYRGRVLELMTDVGELIAPGSRLFTLEEIDEPIDTVVYVNAGEGKKVRPGMECRISPSTVKAEEYGFMVGTVAEVSEFPVTPEGLSRVLRNETLVAQMTAQGAPIEIKVVLAKDPDTPSGFKWSSAQGPPYPVFTGTLTTAQIIVEKKKPISLILPIFKSAVGVQ